MQMFKRIATLLLLSFCTQVQAQVPCWESCDWVMQHPESPCGVSVDVHGMNSSGLGYNPSVAQLEQLPAHTPVVVAFDGREKIPSEYRKFKRDNTRMVFENLSTPPKGIRKLSKKFPLHLKIANGKGFPEWICDLDQVTTLTLEGKLDEIPKEIACLSQLEILYIKHLPQVVSPALAELPTLRHVEVDIYDEPSKQALAILGSLHQLKSLKVKFENSPKTPQNFPDEFFKLKNLRSLSVHGSLELFSDKIGEMSALESLTLSGGYPKRSPLTKLPLGLEKLTQLKKLTITRTHLADLPKGLLALSNLESLNLAKNDFEGLPAWISNFKQLQSLNIKSNKLKTFPSFICQMHNLVHLNAGRNELEEIPGCLGKLKALEMLSLTGNKLKTIPPTISKLRNLQDLDLSGNPLESLPDDLGNFPNLQEFRCADNELDDLPVLLKKWLSQGPVSRRMYLTPALREVVETYGKEIEK